MEASVDILRILSVAGGIGLVIFVHELGHFLAARWCGVRVETFSLGIGPRLLGYRRGATLYQLALFPIGGYCRMAGEERRFDGLPPAPDELPAKSVGQRFFIYSGGVLMNVLFGLIVFPILFTIGVPFLHPTIGETLPGSPAWHAGIPVGSEVVRVNGSRVFDFYQIPTEVALGDPQYVEVVVRDPETGLERTFGLAPRDEVGEGIRSIGVTPALERDALGNAVLDVRPGSPADVAGLESGDRLVQVNGGVPGLGPWEQIQIQGGSGEAPLSLRVVGVDGERDLTIQPGTLEQTNPPRVGISPPRNHVLAVRDLPLTRRVGIEEGDRLLSVGGAAIRELGDLRRALIVDRAGPLVIEVLRAGAVLRLEPGELTRDEALELADDLAVVQDLESTEVVVTPGQPAALAGIETGDRVLRVDSSEVATWEELHALVRRASDAGRAAHFEVERLTADSDVPAYLSFDARPEERPAPSYGISFRSLQYTYRAEGIGQAMGFGVHCSWKFLKDTWVTLKRIMMQDISAKNLGGIITIGAVSYSFAAAGWVKLFYFLCLLSINLAFLNVLPIPVLDGGHLFFLIVEKIKGSPVSERVLGYSQMIGVVLILSLLVYVTYNDLARWVFRS